MRTTITRSVLGGLLAWVLTTGPAAAQIIADLAVEFGPNSSPVPVGQPFDIDLHVRNLSPSTIPAALLNIGIPPALGVVSVTPESSCIPTSGGVRCSFSSLPPSATIPVTLTLFPPIVGTFTVSASFSSPLIIDLNSTNNSATKQITTENLAAGFPFLDPEDVELELGQTQTFKAFSCPGGSVGLDGIPGTDDDGCQPISVCWSVAGGIGTVDPSTGPETDFDADFPGMGQVFAIADEDGNGFCNDGDPKGGAGVAVVVSDCGGLCANADGTVVNGKIVKKVTPQDPNITGTAAPEILCGDERRNVLVGRGGDDILCGFGEQDALSGGFGDDLLFGHDGDDQQMEGGPGDDTLFGGPGDDVLRGGPDAGTQPKADLLVGGPGDDTLDGELGDDRLFGDKDPTNSAGDVGAPGMDTLKGGEGEDLLVGGPEMDRLEGGPDNDALLGQEGNDRLKGGPDDDLLVGGGNAPGDVDELDGSAGQDVLFGDQPQGLFLNGLKDAFGFDPTDPGGPGDDILSGGPRDDDLFGGEGDDQLEGGPGNDDLDGEAGLADDCDGGAGPNDTAQNCEVVNRVP